MILAVPFLSATGIYNPPVVQHGRCIAEPGSFNALFCMGVAESSEQTEVSGTLTGREVAAPGVRATPARAPKHTRRSITAFASPMH